MKDAADGRAGETSGMGDLDDAATVLMALKAFNNTQTASERKNEVGVAGVCSEFVDAGGSLLRGGMAWGRRHPGSFFAVGDYRTPCTGMAIRVIMPFILDGGVAQPSRGDRNEQLALATMCIGVGQGIAMAIERV